MNLLQTLRVALRALMRNKTRSFLTTLGIVFGVAAVIAMVAIGEGAKAKVAQTFASLGTNMLIIMPGSSSGGGVHGGFGSAPTLTWEDLKAVQGLSAVRHAAPLLRLSTQVLSEDQNWNTAVFGTTDLYFDIRNWGAACGVRLSASDVENGSKVVVLGKTVVEQLYGANADPVGQRLRIKNVPFEIVGVLAPKGQSPMGQDLDDAVFVPYTTFQARIQGSLENYIPGSIFVSAMNAAETTRAKNQVTVLLRDRHHLDESEVDDFSIRNLTEFASAQQESTRMLSALLASIAAISLLVGGIGIMNIMLVSVTERTREIGLRMAVGARPRDILTQFLSESLALALLGGVIGVGLGIGAATWIAGKLGLESIVRLDIIALSFSFSALVGLVFGIYPAHRASRCDPMQALRYE